MRCFASVMIAVLGCFGVAASLAGVSDPPKPLPMLDGEDADKTEELNEKIDGFGRKDELGEALKNAKELAVFLSDKLGENHYRTVDARWKVKTLTLLADKPRADRVAYWRAWDADREAFGLQQQGKYKVAEERIRQEMEIFRRILGEDHPYTAASYNNLAFILNAQSQYLEAEKLYRKGLEASLRIFGDDHPNTANSYNNVASNLDDQGKYAEAEKLYQKGLEIHLRILGEDHADTATIYNNIAGNLSEQSKYAEAEKLYRKGLAICLRVLGEDHADTASSYDNLATNLNTQGKYAESEKLHRKGLEIRRRIFGEMNPETAKSYDGLATNLNTQSKLREAEDFYRRALRIRLRIVGQNDSTTGASYNNIAFNVDDQGKHAEAEELYRKGLQIFRETFGENHTNTATCYNNLATNLDSQGKSAEAEDVHRKSLQIRLQVLGEEHALTAASFNNLAFNLMARNKHVQAEEFVLKGLEIHIKNFGQNHPATASSYNNVASCFNAQGKYAESEKMYRKALEINRRVFGENHPATATSYNNVALNLNAQGQYREAEELTRKGLEIRLQAQGEDHSDSAVIRYNLGGNLNAQGKYQEAQTQWRQGLDAFEKNRLLASFDSLGRSSFGAKRAFRLSLSAVALRLKADPVVIWSHFESDLGRGLWDELLEKSQSRLSSQDQARLASLRKEIQSFEQLFEKPQTQRPDQTQVWEQFRQRQAQALIELRGLETQLFQEQNGPPTQPLSLKDIQSRLPDHAALIGWLDAWPLGPNDADPDGGHWALVLRSKGEPRWLELPGSGPKGVWTKEDRQLPIRLHQLLSQDPTSQPLSVKELVRQLRTLRWEPLKPVLQSDWANLPPVRNVVVLPSRDLQRIPIEALSQPDEPWSISYAPSGTVLAYLRKQPKTSPERGLLALGDPTFETKANIPLLDPTHLPDHGLLIRSVVPGSNAARANLAAGDVLLKGDQTRLEKLADLQAVLALEKSKPNVVEFEVWRSQQAGTKRIRLPRGRLGVAFDLQPAPRALRQEQEYQKLMLASRKGSEELTRLPGTLYEVRQLADLCQKANLSANVLTGSDASEQKLHAMAESGELTKYRFIHLATHGTVNEQFPMRTAVMLARDSLPDSFNQVIENQRLFDGELRVGEIRQAWKLQADLVTLSACQTALGQEQGGDSFVGFTQALLLVGAKSVCLSMWKVDDSATALLMERFYSNLLGSQGKTLGKAEALKEAKTWLRTLKRKDAETRLQNLVANTMRGVGSDLKLRPNAKVPDPLAKPSNQDADDQDHPYANPYYWAAFVLVGDFE